MLRTITGCHSMLKSLEARAKFVRRKIRSPMGCTTLVAVPPATINNQVYLLWNFDLLLPLKPLTDRFQFFVTGGNGYKYVAWGIPNFLHFGLMNEHGLSFVGNAVGVTDGGEDGYFGFELVNQALSRCKNTLEVIPFFQRAKRLALAGQTACTLANFNSMWADPDGNAVTIEYSQNHVAVHQVGEDGVMVEANHHQYLDHHFSGNTDPSQQPAIAGSYARLGRAWELAKELAGQFDFETVVRFAADHGQNYSLLSGYDFEIPKSGWVDDSTICVHHWNLFHYLRKLEFGKILEMIAEGSTFYSFVLEPKNRTIWFCDGRPCRTPFLELDFSGMLKKGPYQPSTLQRELFLSAVRLLEKMLPM